MYIHIHTHTHTYTKRHKHKYGIYTYIHNHTVLKTGFTNIWSHIPVRSNPSKISTHCRATIASRQRGLSYIHMYMNTCTYTFTCACI